MKGMINYEVQRIPAREAKEYICKYHYSHGCHNGPSPCYGLFDGPRLIGVCAFATPCSERVRASVFGPAYKDHVTELHRLHILDCTPTNTESWFISRCLRKLKQDNPGIWAVIAFSDLTVGHTGTIYRAANAYFIGTTQKKLFFIDQNGRLRHPRQCGRNISKVEANTMRWQPVRRDAKNRFLFLLPDNKYHKRKLIRLSKYDLQQRKSMKTE